MTWAALHDAVQGPVVLAVDGLVVEAFYNRTAETARLHAALAHVAVSGPDRKGRYTVEVTNRAGGRGGGFQLLLDADNWARAYPVLQAFDAAAAAAGLR